MEEVVSRFKYHSKASTSWQLQEVDSVGVTNFPVVYFPGVTQVGGIDSNGPIIHFYLGENHWFGVFAEFAQIFQEAENEVGVFGGNHFHRIDLNQPLSAQKIELVAFSSEGEIRYAGGQTYFQCRSDGIYKFSNEGTTELMDLNELYDQFSFTAAIMDWMVVSEDRLDILVNDDNGKSWQVTLDTKDESFVNELHQAK